MIAVSMAPSAAIGRAVSQGDGRHGLASAQCPRRRSGVPVPLRLALLLFGLWVFGTGEACLVAAQLGNSPWPVLSQGVARHTCSASARRRSSISLGIVLALWIPLRQAPGLGTVLNAIVIGLAIAVMLPVLPDHRGAGVAWPLLAAGIALVALGGGIYLGTRLGPGPARRADDRAARAHGALAAAGADRASRLSGDDRRLPARRDRSASGRSPSRAHRARGPGGARGVGPKMPRLR